MRLFLTIFVFIFSLQSSIKADDIKDLEIEGMSIGDSLLDYFSKEEIKNSKNKFNYPKSNKFILWVPNSRSYENYDAVQFHFKTNDANYIIQSIGGHITYYEKIEKCYPKKKDIFDSLKEMFPNTEVKSQIAKHQLDNKTIVDQTVFNFDQGYITLECYDWSKELEDKYGDKLSLGISTSEFMNWITNEAY